MALVAKSSKKSLVKRFPITGREIDEISEYFHSKHEEQTRGISHYPEWDVICGEPVLDMVRAQGELLMARQTLESKRHEYEAQKIISNRHWENLRSKELELREAFVKYDEFVRENQGKRERAQRRIEVENETQMLRRAEIDELESLLASREATKNRMIECVEKLKPYQYFLEDVIKDSSQFQTISDIFDRYDVLMEMRESLMDHQERTLQKMENNNLRIKALWEQRISGRMELNSRLAELENEYEEARKETLHWEEVVSKIKSAAAAKASETSQIRASIWNIYRQICHQKNVQVTARKNDIEQHLLHIKRTIVELNKIVKAAKKKAGVEERLKKKALEAELAQARRLEEAEMRRNQYLGQTILTSSRFERTSIATTREQSFRRSTRTSVFTIASSFTSFRRN